MKIIKRNGAEVVFDIEKIKNYPRENARRLEWYSIPYSCFLSMPL